MSDFIRLDRALEHFCGLCRCLFGFMWFKARRTAFLYLLDLRHRCRSQAVEAYGVGNMAQRSKFEALPIFSSCLSSLWVVSMHTFLKLAGNESMSIKHITQTVR